MEVATTMDTYDPASYLPGTFNFGGGHNLHLDYMSATSNVDPLDQYSNFDSETYMR